MEGEITLKINYLNDIRRISVATKPAVNDLRNIVRDLYSATQLATQDFALKWLDDEGDLISLVTDREMNEAWNFALRVNSKILRVSVLPVETKPATTTTTVQPAVISKPVSGDPSLLSSNPLLSSILAKSDELNIKLPIEVTSVTPAVVIAPPKAPSPPPLPGVKRVVYEEKPASPPSAPSPIRYPLRSVIHNAICDSCNNRIVGKRFKCTVCGDYDLVRCFPHLPLTYEITFMYPCV